MSEARNALDLPGINGIEDLDEDVDGFDTHLDALAPGNVVTLYDPDVVAQYVVTGRHESSGKGCHHESSRGGTLLQVW